MNDLVRPFASLRPRADCAADVVAPPYDVVDADEARELAIDRPSSFLRISRPEIEFPPATDPYSDQVYARAAENLARLIADGILVRDSRPGYYIYRLEMGSHVQMGIALTASVSAYEQNLIKRHELTRPTKESDRVRNMEALNAQTGPVILAYRSEPALDAAIAAHSEGQADISVLGPHDVRHSIWRIDEPAVVAKLTDLLCGLEALYIADGHHRSAAALRVAESRRSMDANPSDSSEYFLAVAFADKQLQILDYNRVVSDLNGLSEDDFLARVRERFNVLCVDSESKPDAKGKFSMYLGGRWYRLSLVTEAPGSDPVERLDIRRLQRELLEPTLDIGDPRTDPRIDFVGGVRGLKALADRVDSGRAAVAFALYPTSMAELMAVADASRLMPPKSTWFEPKLADGLLTHVLD